jgi:hypothetical protein
MDNYSKMVSSLLSSIATISKTTKIIGRNST